LLTKLIDSIENIDDYFVPNRKMAPMLGKSRQAIAKDQRIKNFIYNITTDGKTMYLKESIEQFKASGNGKFSLIDRLKEKITGEVARSK
jgi:hypothetical protein